MFFEPFHVSIMLFPSVFLNNKKQQSFGGFPKLFAVRTGLEPATPCVTGMYSNQLNYRTIDSCSFQLASAKIGHIFENTKFSDFFCP